MKVLITERLVLREFGEGDEAFILQLLNTEGWLRYIGNRNVYSLQDATAYITRLRKSYTDFGFGLYAMELKQDGLLIGMCGLVQRDFMPDADIGFALLPEYESQGYAYEAAAATMLYARTTLGLPRIAAVTAPENTASIALLQKLGMNFHQTIRFPQEEKDTLLFLCD